MSDTEVEAISSELMPAKRRKEFLEDHIKKVAEWA
jgi:hypothetical protein